MNEYIFDASEDYMIDHSLMKMHNKDLEPSNIVIMDCGLERYCETMWMNCDKVSFKICGISYIGNGTPPPNALVMLGTSPSKKHLW